MSLPRCRWPTLFLRKEGGGAMNVADGPLRPCSRGQGAAGGRTQQTGDNTARAPPTATRAQARSSP